MNVIKEMLSNIETTPLQIGRVGENLHTQVRINCITIFQDYPEALVDMAVVPPVGDAYPAIVERDGVVVVWDVLSSDLAYEGRGQIQLTFRDDEEIIKTVIGSTTILPSIEPTGEAPTPIENWIDEANEILDEFGEVTNMTASAETVAAGASAEATVSKVDGHFNINFKIPRGASGNETIDDTAGIGDTDKVWSADKDAKEISALKSAKAPIITESISTPADVQTFPDGADGMLVKTLTVGIDPVQDLHGYDSPWPAGGGKNKAPVNSFTAQHDTVMTFSPNLPAGTYTISYKATRTGSDSRNGAARFIYDDDTYDSSYIYVDGARSTQTITFSKPVASIYVYSISGSYSDSGSYTLTANDFQIESGSSASDFAPYSNICPITGHTGANVTRTGKNLFGGSELKSKLQTITGATTGTDTVGDYVTFAGSSAMSGIPLFDKFKANTQYTVILKYKKSNTNTASNIAFLYSDGTFGYINSQETAAEGALYTAVITSTSGKTITDIRAIYASGNTTVYYNLCGVFEGVLTADQFAPYTGNTYHITFPEAAGTVYGGTLTIHQDGSGELVVDRATITKNTSTMNNSEDYPGWQSSGIKSLIGSGWNQSFINQKLNVGTCFAVNTTSSYDILFLPKTGVQGYNKTQEEWKALAIDVQIVAELATHVSYTLTCPQVLSLLGTNNLWADTGKINALEYPADTKLYIDKKLTELQALVLEN